MTLKYFMVYKMDYWLLNKYLGFQSLFSLGNVSTQFCVSIFRADGGRRRETKREKMCVNEETEQYIVQSWCLMLRKIRVPWGPGIVFVK